MTASVFLADVGHPPQDVAGLALEGSTDRVEGAESDGLGPTVLQDRDIRRRNLDRFDEISDRHLPFGELNVNVDDNRH